MSTRKKRASAHSTMISGCCVQVGPTSYPTITPEMARAVEAVASAVTASARAAEALAVALRGAPLTFTGSGISVQVPS